MHRQAESKQHVKNVHHPPPAVRVSRALSQHDDCCANLKFLIIGEARVDRHWFRAAYGPVQLAPSRRTPSPTWWRQLPTGVLIRGHEAADLFRCFEAETRLSHDRMHPDTDCDYDKVHKTLRRSIRHVKPWVPSGTTREPNPNPTYTTVASVIPRRSTTARTQ